MTRLHAFNREQLLASARGELFGAAAGRLPNDPMLMFDRITDIREDGGPHGKGMVRAELDIRPDLWFFGCHFIGDPVMPGCLGLDAMWQLTGFFLTWLGAPGKGRALGCGEVKFTGQVLPDAKLVRYEIDISRVINRKLVMAQSDARMYVDDREIYSARDLRVGLFTETGSFGCAAASSLALASRPASAMIWMPFRLRCAKGARASPPWPTTPKRACAARSAAVSTSTWTH